VGVLKEAEYHSAADADAAEALCTMFGCGATKGAMSKCPSPAPISLFLRLYLLQRKTSNAMTMTPAIQPVTERPISSFFRGPGTPSLAGSDFRVEVYAVIRQERFPESDD
jgi:hypothetical protein